MTDKNTDAKAESSLQLTPDIITALELNRVIRELENLDDFLHQANLKLKEKKVHISFAVEPSPRVIRKIVLWMRENIHPQVVVEIGVQPTISVGCIVRTTNKVFDMSLRNRFSSSKTILIGLVENKQ